MTQLKKKTNKEESLLDICKELEIYWTDNPNKIKKFINNEINIALEKEQRRKDC